MQVCAPRIPEIKCYLGNCLQFVRIQNCLSERVVITGAPQQDILSPFLFRLYTSDLKYNLEVMPPVEVLE